VEAGSRLRRAEVIAAALVVLLAASLVVRADPPARELTIETLDGTPVRPFTSAARAWVFVFTRTDCPVAARYAPELQRLQERAVSAHVAFHLVFVDPAETGATVRAYLHDYGYAGRALRDPEHHLVHIAGATATPEAAVFVPSSDGPVLVYRGRIDDRYVDIGRVRPAPTRHDLDEVLTAVAQGQKLEPRSTPAVGCLIADVTR
jgi:hypothetical protein